jgi:hypothetical protein
VIVDFIDIGGIVDHHCLKKNFHDKNYLDITKGLVVTEINSNNVFMPRNN